MATIGPASSDPSVVRDMVDAGVDVFRLNFSHGSHEQHTAMLEMIRLKLIRVFQSGAVGPIRVYKRARPADAPKPLLDPEERHAQEAAAAAAVAEGADVAEGAPTADDLTPGE